MTEKQIRKLTSGPMVIFEDLKIAVEVLRNCVAERIVREKGITSKFYSWNHQIVRIDFTNKCKNIEYVKVIK